jgi:hypothetical protein
MAHLLPGDGIMGSYDITDTSGPGSLSGCQAGVLDDFDAARRDGRQVTSEDFAQWARTYREAHPGILKRLAGGASDAFYGVRDALGGLLSFLDSVDSEGGGDYSNDGRSERTSRSSGSGDDSAEPFRRLMGAQNKELSKYDAIINEVYAGADGKSFDGNKVSKVTP